MTPFEEELKRALTRCEPSADFAERVLARVAEAAPKRSWNSGRWLEAVRGWRPLMAVAAATLMIAGGSFFQQQHARTVRGEQAKEKLLVAMRITGWKLQQVQERVQQVEGAEVKQ